MFERLYTCADQAPLIIGSDIRDIDPISLAGDHVPTLSPPARSLLLYFSLILTQATKCQLYFI
jgi:hypothetical protein